MKENMEPICFIYKTYDYDLFHLIENNRKIDHAEVVAKSVKKNGQLFSPIMVDKSYGILDGQNRFEAFKKLGLPVYFFINDVDCDKNTDDIISAINCCNKQWTYEDFLNLYVNNGIEDYLKFNEFKFKYGFPMLTCIHLLRLSNMGGFHSISSEGNFKSGTFKIKDYKKSCEIADAIRGIQDAELSMFNSKKVSIRREFLHAIMKLMLFEEKFDPKVFIKKISINPGILQIRASVKDYILHINEIYNHRNKNKVTFNLYI